MTTPEYLCVITGTPITALGSRQEVINGEKDGLSTNIGLVSREGLPLYDEAVQSARRSTHFNAYKRIIEQLDGVPSGHFQQILHQSDFSEIPKDSKDSYLRRDQKSTRAAFVKGT